MPANGADFDDRAMRIAIIQGLATSVSTDGTTALLRFRTADGLDLELMLPAHAIKVLATMVQDLIAAANQRKVGMGNVQPRRPRTSFVGHSAQDRGAVYLMFDRDTSDEVAIALRDDDALKLADAMRVDVISRMAPQQRAKMLGGLINSAAKLILPNGG
jgi:hypothetical protein